MFKEKIAIFAKNIRFLSMKKKDLYRLNIYVDVECQVYCDFSLKGTASHNTVFKLYFKHGSSHILDFRVDEISQFVHEYITRTDAKVDTIRVQLARVLYKKENVFMPYSIGSPKYLFIDTETTGLPKYYEYEEGDEPSYSNLKYWPHVVQVAFVIYDCNWNRISENSYIVYPDNYSIPKSSTRIHRISNEEAMKKGVRREELFSYLHNLLSKVEYIIGHNVRFDINVLKCEIMRIKEIGKVAFKTKDFKIIDTMEIGARVCRVPSLLFNGYKYPSLDELYKTLFLKDIKKQHNALADVRATVDCFNKMYDLSLLDFDIKGGSGNKFIKAKWLDTEGFSNFQVTYKKYEKDDGTYEYKLVLAYTNKEGSRRCRRISNDSELTEGDIIDEETIEVLTFMDSEEKTHRVDADILDEEESGWELVSSEKLAGIEDVEMIFIVNKIYIRPNGHEVSRKSMCFKMNDGSKRFIPLCKDSCLDIADTVDIDSVFLYKYDKNGHTRYGVDGDFKESNLGYKDRCYIDISSFENINKIKEAYVDSETRYSHYYGLQTSYKQLLIRIEFEDDEFITYDLDSDSELEIIDDVEPQSIIIFTFEKDGKEIETADASKLEYDD